MAGIERIHIDKPITGRGAWRFWESWRRWKIANDLYRQAFPTLLSGYELVECTEDEFKARYDTDLAIDVILWFESGPSAGLQEKFLYTTFNTLTVENMQNRFTNEPGDWFNMKCQFYFVGYDTSHLNCSTRYRENVSHVSLDQEMETGICSICKKPFKFDPWVLLNWGTVLIESELGNIPWEIRDGKYDGARSNFRFVHFDKIPQTCIIASSKEMSQPMPKQMALC